MKQTTKDTFELGIGKGIKKRGFNAHYKSALSAMAKQQMLLGRVLDTIYSKHNGTTWRRDLEMLKQKWTNPQNILDSIADNDDTGEPETAADSDSTSEQESLLG